MVVNTTSGAIIQELSYDEWGNILSDTNSGFQPFGFAGGLYDPDTKLVRHGARDYDPAIGRWTSKDPIRLTGNDPNFYNYVVNDPINLIDPTGLITYKCTKPLDALTNKFGIGISQWAHDEVVYAYHQYSCIVNSDGVQCGGQDHEGSPVRSDGKASDDQLRFPGCQISEENNECFESCLIEEWAKPRPKYGIPFGQDCQEYDDAVNERCSLKCILKNRPGL